MQGIIDRLEEGIAVLQLEGGGELFFPAHQLPPGSKEGSVLEILIKLDKEATAERKEIIRKKQERLKRRPG